jgi:hypothetical protein
VKKSKIQTFSYYPFSLHFLNFEGRKNFFFPQNSKNEEYSSAVGRGGAKKNEGA